MLEYAALVVSPRALPDGLFNTLLMNTTEIKKASSRTETGSDAFVCMTLKIKALHAIV